MATTTRARKAAPAKPAAKVAAPAAKAPAKRPAATTAPPAGPKLRWQFPDGFDNRTTTGQTATSGDREYKMLPVDGKWRATVTVGKKTTVLSDGSHGAACAACVKHNKSA